MKTNTRLSLLAGSACLFLTVSPLIAQSSTGTAASAAAEDNAAAGNGARGRGRGMAPGTTANLEAQVQRLNAAVNLTDEQKAKILAIYQDEATKLQTVRADPALTPEQRMAKIQEIQTAGRTSVRALLTTGQQQTYDAMPSAGGRGNRGGGPDVNDGEGRGNRGGPGGGGPGAGDRGGPGTGAPGDGGRGQGRGNRGGN